MLLLLLSCKLNLHSVGLDLDKASLESISSRPNTQSLTVRRLYWQKNRYNIWINQRVTLILLRTQNRIFHMKTHFCVIIYRSCKLFLKRNGPFSGPSCTDQEPRRRIRRGMPLHHLERLAGSSELDWAYAASNWLRSLPTLCLPPSASLLCNDSNNATETIIVSVLYKFTELTEAVNETTLTA